MNIKIVTYNIHKGFSIGGQFTLHEMRDALAALKPDVILLQEVVGENRRHQKKIPTWPTEAQHEFVSSVFGFHAVYGKNAVFPIRHHGNAILSRFPIRNWENINISNNRWEQRGLLHAILEIDRQPLHIFNVHLDLTELGRQRQLKRILTRGTEHVPHHEALIVAGDMNDWGKKFSSPLLENLDLRESYSHLHGKHAATFPSFRPLLQLDRFYSRHLRIHHAQVLREKPWPGLSDHLPLYFELELSAATGKSL